MTAPCEVLVTESGVHCTPRGKHKLGALNRGFFIPADCLVSAKLADDEINAEFRWNGLTMFRAGSFVPGVYKAGYFCPWKRSSNGKRTKSFWLVRHPERAVVLDLRDFRYDRVIIEVDNPDQVLTDIAALSGNEESA